MKNIFYDKLEIRLFYFYVTIFFTFVSRSYRISFVENGNGIFSCSICDMEFRRLSTKSSVLGETNENNLTEWKWYWKEKDNCWHEYTIWVSSLFPTAFL